MKLYQVKYIKEGGGALASAGVIRVAREDVPKTIEVVSRITGIPKEELTPLGSSGKMPTSGDLDLAIDASAHNAEEIHKRMLMALGGDQFGTYNKGTKVGSYAVPIAGDKEKGLVQVDLMYVPNTKWAEFSYFSAGEKSKYKGAVRAIFLGSIAATLDEPGKDAFVYDKGELIVRVGRGISPNIGLKRMFQMRPEKKSGEGYLKTMKNVSPELIKKLHPHLDFDVNDNAIVDDPKEVVQILFGIGTKPSDVDSVEEIIDIMKRTFPKERYEQVMTRIAKKIAPLANKMEIPPEVQEYME